MNIAKQTLRLSACTISLIAGFQASAWAQASASAAAASDNTEQVVVTGNRFGARTATDSPTPVDYVSAKDLRNTGATELQGMLKVEVPSFSTPSPATGSALDFLQPPTLRGLGPGEVLVLLNGKRYHPDSTLNTGVQIGRGDIEYNFNSIPAAALSGTEVLRDGASAQYGSDAIAGVINLRLDDSIGTDVRLRTAITTRGDGQEADFSIGQGFDLGNGGFIRITGDYKASGSTNRALPDTRQQYFGISPTGALLVPSGNFGSGIGLTPSNGALDPREATINRNMWHFGDDPYHSESLVLNSQYPISPDITAYAFADYNHLIGNSPQFFRIAANDATVRALYPNGFLPIAVIRLTNITGTIGVKGESFLGFKWDLSTTYGGSFNQTGFVNSANPSLGPSSPRTFNNSGRSNFVQSTTNLDLTREVDLGDLGPLDIAFGAEYRYERYANLAGEPASYANGGAVIPDGPHAGAFAPVGSQTGAIFPADSVALGRGATSEYAEIHKKFWSILDVDAAVRHENYSDFGDVTNFKVAGRIALPADFALRASFSTGLRAPALAQEGYSATNPNFVNSNIVFTKFVPAGTALGKLIGAPALRPEASDNVSAGIVYAGDQLTGSIDVYQIKLKHRIVLSSSFSSGALTNFLATQGFPSISSVAFETNAVDTTTQGVDITGRYRYQTDDWGTLTATLAANFSYTEFDRIAATPSQLTAFGITTPIVDLTSQFRLARATPKNKETLELNWSFDSLDVDLSNTRYGTIGQVDFASATPAQIASFGNAYSLQLYPISGSSNSQVVQYFRPDIVTDLNIGYALTDEWKITVGASNLFDVYPERQIASTAGTVAAGTNGGDNAGIFPYAYPAPYGTVGRLVYLEVGLHL